jgi:hypothetical protein
MSSGNTPPALDYKSGTVPAQPLRLHDDEELHRYVTDEMPRQAKMSTSSTAPLNQGGALIVSVGTLFSFLF